MYLIEAQFFQMLEPTCISPNGFGVSSCGSDLPPPPPRTMVEAFMAAQKGMLCQILQTQQQLVQMLQQQTPLGANPDGPNLVAQTMNSTKKDPAKPKPSESCSPRCNTLKFGSFRMLIGKIIKQRFSHNFKILPNIYFLYRRFSIGKGQLIDFSNKIK
jgi:hypothetical protein